jgi:hypothetical protein
MMSKSELVYVIYIRTTPVAIMVGANQSGFHEAILVRHAFRDRLEKRLLMAIGISRWVGRLYRRDCRGRSAQKCSFSGGATKLRAESKIRRIFALCDRSRTLTGAVKLTITHLLDQVASKFIEAVSSGWPRILSNPKNSIRRPN